MPNPIPFGEFRPDEPALSQWAREALNVVPQEESYGPLNALATTTNALGSACQGAAWFRAPANVVKTFAGDGTHLYLLAGAVWSNVSSGPYTPGIDSAWKFSQFGTLAIAVDGVDVPQKFDMSSAATFAQLGGTPPVGKYVCTGRDFLFMGNIGETPQRLQWSAENDAETWGSDPATQADFQDLPDGGNITGLVGGEYVVCMQEAAVRRVTYEGPPVVWRIDKISNDVGCTIPGSVAGVLDLAFFLHKSGFYMVQTGATVVPIGRGKVDRTFWAEFDESNSFASSSAIDPVRGLYVFAYPVIGGDGQATRALIYNWRTDRWARANITCEIVFSGVTQQGYTLEQLDQFGNLDTLAFSLDSPHWTGAVMLLLSAFDRSHTSGAFTGSTLQAILETNEINPGGGKRSVVRGCRPLIDGGSPTIQLGVRETQQAAVAYGSSVSLTPAGMAPLYGSGRYVRLRATIPAAGTWSNAQGIDDLDFRPAGAQ